MPLLARPLVVLMLLGMLFTTTVARAGVPVVEVAGTPDEMGAAHGKQLGTQITTLFNQYLTRYFTNNAKRVVALTSARMFQPFMDPDHLAEVRALAKEVKLDDREVLLGQCFLDLTPMTACSTVTLPADAAPDNVARFGRNLDFPSLGVADKHTVLMIVRPAGKYGFASVSWPGLIGVLSGMNEHGLALANMEVERGPRLPGAMPYTLLYRSVLERCRTVDEAVAFLEKTPRQTPNNLMLMDAAGNRAVVEITPEKVVVRRGGEAKALMSTNHQRGEGEGSKRRCWRYDALERMSGKQFGKIDVKAIEGMLAEVAQGKMTLQSMVFEPSTLTLYLASGANAPKKPFERIELKRYFEVE